MVGACQLERRRGPPGNMATGHCERLKQGQKAVPPRKAWLGANGDRAATVRDGKRALNELEEQIREHIERETAENIERGMAPKDARNAAVRKFGNVTRVKEDARDVWTVMWLDRLLQDTRYGLRGLWRSPGFAITAIFTLSLGIAATVAIFGFADAALIRPLAYPELSRLMEVTETSAGGGSLGGYSFPNYLDLARENGSFDSIAGYDGDGDFVLSGGGQVELVKAIGVTGDFFRMLGAKPILGRDFDSGEGGADLQAASSTVILSYTAWQKRFGGSPDALGKTVTLNGQAYTVIGVLPRSFSFAPAGAMEFWTTLRPYAADPCHLSRGCTVTGVIARLKEGVTLGQAQGDVRSVAAREASLHPDPDKNRSANIVPLSEAILGDIRPILLAVLSGAGLLLLIAYVNVASLLLVRSENRRREFALRGALGASRGRLVQQFVTEGLVVVGVSGALGLLAAAIARRLLLTLIPADMLDRMPYLRGTDWNWHVAAFAAALLMIACALFACTPALRLSFANLRAGLAEGGRGAAGTTWRHLGAKLVVLELATTMVLLCGAGLLGKSLYQLMHIAMGFDPDHLATVWMLAPDPKYSADEQAVALQREVINDLQSVAGVTGVGLARALPATGVPSTQIGIVGRPTLGVNNQVGHQVISAQYLPTLKAHLLQGRYFNENDGARAPLVAIINQTLARRYFSGENPIGKQIFYHAHDINLEASQPPIQIVGVVADFQECALDRAEGPVVFTPSEQGLGASFYIAVRTSQDAAGMLPSLIATIHKVDAGIVTADGETMPEIIQGSPTAYWHRATSWVAGGFAALALVLSTVGLYGVIAYSVSRRTREIGVRMALGAGRGSVYALILREAGWLMVVGMVIGVAGAIGAGVLMRGLLFGVGSWDRSVLGGVAGVLIACGLAASYVPARRAASVNPVEALRAE
jgi:macrolide transport system ATP-binding/permease protein